MKHLFIATFFISCTFTSLAQMANLAENDFILVSKQMQAKYKIKASILIANAIIFSEATNGQFDKTNIFNIREGNDFKVYHSVYDSFQAACLQQQEKGNVFFGMDCKSVQNIIKKYKLTKLDYAN